MAVQVFVDARFTTAATTETQYGVVINLKRLHQRIELIGGNGRWE